jgi:hypothetical protein
MDTLATLAICGVIFVAVPAFVALGALCGCMWWELGEWLGERIGKAIYRRQLRRERARRGVPVKAGGRLYLIPYHGGPAPAYIRRTIGVRARMHGTRPALPV